MPLNKTTDLPASDPEFARRVFGRLVHDEPLVLLVVFGEDAEAERLVSRADQVSGGPFDLRGVVWMRNPSAHQDQIAQLRSSNLLQGPAVAAFCTNHDDEICDVIRRSELPVGFTRIIQAFVKGEV